MRIYTYKNKSFQIVQWGDIVASEWVPTNMFEVCDLNGKNIFGSAFFESIQDAIKELELYIDIISPDFI